MSNEGESEELPTEANCWITWAEYEALEQACKDSFKILYYHPGMYPWSPCVSGSFERTMKYRNHRDEHAREAKRRKLVWRIRGAKPGEEHNRVREAVIDEWVLPRRP